METYQAAARLGLGFRGAGRAGGAGGLRRLGAGRLIKAPRAESRSGTARSRFDFSILNKLQKSRNKFSPTSKINPGKMNIYLGPKCNFEKHAFFLNSNKIAINSKIKSYLILLSNPQYFFILGKSFYSLSHIFIIEIIEDKINKIK